MDTKGTALNPLLIMYNTSHTNRNARPLPLAHQAIHHQGKSTKSRACSQQGSGDDMLRSARDTHGPSPEL
jgi:hypothetical protein